MFTPRRRVLELSASACRFVAVLRWFARNCRHAVIRRCATTVDPVLRIAEHSWTTWKLGRVTVNIRFPLAVCLVSVFTSATAYEDDVHYGLTRWLAEKARYSTIDAEIIAAGDVDYDRSKMSAIRLVLHSGCLLAKDAPTSEEVQRVHFPGEGKVPGAPATRRVSPGSIAANRELNAALSIETETRERGLRLLGKSLHPLQDSWSHQGQPDSPFNFFLGCDADYSWGHPVARGGWESHKADLSDQDMGSAIAMAKATFDALCNYRVRILKLDACDRTFNDLSADVINLLERRTKAAKAEWFKAQGFEDVRFLYAISVPNGGKATYKQEPTRHSGKALVAMESSKRGALPKTLEAEFMREFFTAWMTRKDLDGVVKEWVAIEAYRPNLGQGDVLPVGALAAAVQLRFWRVRDHGSLEQVMEGHNVIGRNYTSVPPAVVPGDEPYGSIDDALLPLDESGLPIATWSTSRPDSEKLLVGAVRIRHAPNDLVIVVAGKVGSGYKVISIRSVVTE